MNTNLHEEVSRPMIQTPLVSVIVATRNRPSLLRVCLEGIRCQTYSNYEVVVIDDASREETIQEYQKFWGELGSRFKLHIVQDANERSGTPAAARNRGLQLSKGRFCAFCDDDDVWTAADHLECGVNAMISESADYFFADMCAARDDKLVWENWFGQFTANLSRKMLAGSTSLFEVPLREFAITMRHCLIHPNMSIIDRKLVEKAGNFCERIVFSEDYEFMMRIADSSRKILFRNQCIAKYRLPGSDAHSNRISEIDQILDRIAATNHIRSRARHSEIRWSARAREAWAMREMSELLRKSGQKPASISFAWQGLCTFPTIGAARDLLRAVI